MHAYLCTSFNGLSDKASEGSSDRYAEPNRVRRPTVTMSGPSSRSAICARSHFETMDIRVRLILKTQATSTTYNSLHSKSSETSIFKKKICSLLIKQENKSVLKCILKIRLLQTAETDARLFCHKTPSSRPSLSPANLSQTCMLRHSRWSGCNVSRLKNA